MSPTGLNDRKTKCRCLVKYRANRRLKSITMLDSFGPKWNLDGHRLVVLPRRGLKTNQRRRSVEPKAIIAEECGYQNERNYRS
jgi:hypothetical protein